MTPAQIDEAGRLAIEWMQSHPPNPEEALKRRKRLEEVLRKGFSKRPLTLPLKQSDAHSLETPAIAGVLKRRRSKRPRVGKRMGSRRGKVTHG